MEKHQIQHDMIQSPSDWAARIREAYGRSVEAIIQVGRELLAAKDAMEHGEFTKMVNRALPFGPRMAQKYMAVARHPVLAKANRNSLLPPSIAQLYVLSRFEPDALTQALRALERKKVDDEGAWSEPALLLRADVAATIERPPVTVAEVQAKVSEIAQAASANAVVKVTDSDQPAPAIAVVKVTDSGRSQSANGPESEPLAESCGVHFPGKARRFDSSEIVDAEWVEQPTPEVDERRLVTPGSTLSVRQIVVRVHAHLDKILIIDPDVPEEMDQLIARCAQIKERAIARQRKRA